MTNKSIIAIVIAIFSYSATASVSIAQDIMPDKLPYRILGKAGKNSILSYDDAIADLYAEQGVTWNILNSGVEITSFLGAALRWTDDEQSRFDYKGIFLGIRAEYEIPDLCAGKFDCKSNIGIQFSHIYKDYDYDCNRNSKGIELKAYFNTSGDLLK